MPKKYSIDTMLISPKVRLVVDEEMAKNMLLHIDDMVSQPSQELALAHGTARSWGVELAQEDNPDRMYRVAFVIEEIFLPNQHTFLTLVAIEEGTQLEIHPEKRRHLQDWMIITVSKNDDN